MTREQTSAGRLHVYDLLRCADAAPPAGVDASRLPRLELLLRGSEASPPSSPRPPLLPGERALDVAAWPGGLLAGTDRGALVEFAWEAVGTLRSRFAPEVSVGAEQQHPRAGSRLVQLALCAQLRAVGCVWDAGEAAVLSFSPDQPHLSLRHAGWLLRAACVSVALSAPSALVAAGTATGCVLLFRLPEQGGPPVQLRSLSLADWGHSPADTGAARSLAFSPCGGALACGYSLRGCALWSASGCRLAHLLPLPQPQAAHGAGVLDGGVAGLAWGAGGGSLLLCGASHAGALLEQALARCPPQRRVVSLSPSPEAASLPLLGADCLLLVERDSPDSQPSDAAGADAAPPTSDDPACGAHACWAAAAASAAERLAIRRVRLPREYAASGWPLRLAAASPDGTHVACAGACGLAVFSVRSGGWRLFGDVAQERALRCASLAWLGCSAIAVVAAPPPARPAAGFELRVYPRSHLDDASLLARLPCGQAQPLALHCDAGGAHLLLALPPLSLSLYAVQPAARSRLDLSLLLSLSLPPRPLSAVLLAPAATAAAPPSAALLLLPGGDLLSVALRPGDKSPPVPSLLASDVEQLWLPCHAAGGGWEADGSDGECGRESPPWWLYGPGGMRLLQPCSPPPDGETEPELAFDRESWPLGPASGAGAVLWLSQQQAGPPWSAFGIDLPAFSPLSRAQPVLPSLLRHLLRLRRDGAARRLARAARGRPHLISSLEWLLFTTLDAHVRAQRRRQPPARSSLERTVALISDSPEFSDVVVSVARKTDEAEWAALFAAAGTPSELFQASLEAGRPRTAACYLLIIHRLQGPGEAPGCGE